MHETQVDGDVLDAQTLTVHLGIRNLTLVMIAAIVETDTQGYLVFFIVEQRDTVHTAAHNDYRILHFVFEFIIYKIILQSNISKICVIHEICVHTYPNRQRSASSTFLTGWMVMLYFDLSSE